VAIADVVHGTAAAAVGTTIAATGGGVLVVVGVVQAALAAPAFFAVPAGPGEIARGALGAHGVAIRPSIATCARPHGGGSPRAA